MTKTEKLLRALRSGKELTAKQIRSQFALANPHRAVHYLREKGISVYGNYRVLRDGTTVMKYRVGTPTKAMAAAGYTR